MMCAQIVGQRLWFIRVGVTCACSVDTQHVIYKEYDMEKQVYLSNDYNCPKCGEPHKDDSPYYADGVRYPIITNETWGSTLDGDYWNWEEVHRCKECNTLFSFENGAY